MNLELEVKLSNDCEKCYGEGEVHEYGSSYTCEACDGLKRIPTDLGRAIIEFHRVFLEPKIRDIVREELQKAGVKLG